MESPQILAVTRFGATVPYGARGPVHGALTVSTARVSEQQCCMEIEVQCRTLAFKHVRAW